MGAGEADAQLPIGLWHSFSDEMNKMAEILGLISWPTQT